MDSDDLVIIENEGPATSPVDPFAMPQTDMENKARQGLASDEESDPDSRFIVHTNVPMRRGKYRYHSYLHDTNDYCHHCHDLLLQTYRERRPDLGSPLPSMVTLVIPSVGRPIH